MHVDSSNTAGLRARLASFDHTGLRMHMIGVGGCGMTGAACLLRGTGASVAGSDLEPFEGMGALTQRGVRVSIGHRAEHLDPKTDLVVISAAIPKDNPELVAAKKRGLPVIKYAELLGWLVEGRQGVALAGAHGKSTTTAMTAHIFREAGLDPSFVMGARSEQLGGNGGFGAGDHLIVEACEYDRSFLKVAPKLAAVLNIEADHFDYYDSFDEMAEAFCAFAARVRSGGVLIVNNEDCRAVEAGRAASATVETFAIERGADWCAANLCADRGRFAFDVLHGGSLVLSTRLSVPGRYNVANALAAIALAYHAGAAPDAIARAVPRFAGIDRRMSYRGEWGGVTVIDDYAHHPTEIKVTIEAARRRYDPKRTWVVFQPHQRSRTEHLLDQFAESFGLADEVIVPDVYAAREARDDGRGPGSAELVSRIGARGVQVRHVPALGAVAAHLANHVTKGDLVLTMGAGDVWKVADELVDRIRESD